MSIWVKGGAVLEDMKKIRINELARELEVKPNVILELLPGLGVTEKKTHSSSIDEDVAHVVRRQLSGEGGGVDREREPSSEEPEAISGAGEPEKRETSPRMPAAPPAPAPGENAGVEAPAAAVTETERPAQPATPAFDVESKPVRPPLPLRPPLAGQPSRPVTSGPVTPTIQPPPQRPAAPAPPAPPVRPSPPSPQPPAAQMAPPQQAAPQQAPRSTVVPAKPLPAPRPGQILTGPRQPFPAEGRPQAAAPGPPKPQPQAPRPQAPRQPQPPQQQQQRQAPRQTGPSQPPPMQQPQQSRPLAGQPAARPVVPPRPDLVARLSSQARPTPGPAQPPRPGAPRPQSAPVPGQPIYRGPIRPGQPLSRPTPGSAAPGGARGPRPRPLHPTSPLRPEAAGPLPTDQRRDAGKRVTRVDRERQRELEEKTLRPAARRRSETMPLVTREINIAEGITVKELSEKLGIKANLVIKKLVERKIFATINQTLDVKMAEDLARAFGATTTQMTFEEETTHELLQKEESADSVKRAPVVTIMGHVDHGKTSLLDAIRETNVAEREAGGITQHIGAYYVEKNGRKIVFIDTPGHAAFTRMRARGAKVTDIVILVVAADDGVMPQTLEAIDHAKAAGVPLIVAINKIDKGDAQPERIKQQLADRGLLAEDWGGETVMVPVSAKAKTNLDLLLEMILLVADLQDFKASPSRPAIGTVLEAKLDRGRGPVATVLVRNGTLRVGDFFICGSVFGKVRAMFDDRGQGIRDAEPSMPVEVLGLDSLPEVGDTFQVVTDTAKAKQIVIYRESKAREQAMAKGARLTLDKLHEQLKEGEVKELNIIVKADVGGTAEVLTDTLHKLSTDKVRVRVLHNGVGAITETDVLLASASNAIIIGFNVRPERNATAVAEQEKVDVRLHTIIYDLTDEIKRAMTGMLEPVYREVYRGRAEVRDVFRITKVGTVAGCMVLDGSITRDSEVRLLRDNIVVHTGRVGTLKRFKNDASEVKSGFECGIALSNYSDIKPGDVIEAFVTERVATEALA